MEIIKKIAMAVFIIGFCFIGGTAFAGNGGGMGGNGTMTHEHSAGGMYVDICAADEVIFTGTISETEFVSRQCISLDTGSEVVVIYGIGPDWYWESLGIEKPGVGEHIIIVTRAVIFSDDSLKNIAISVTFDDGDESDTVQLRDENCLPYWRGGNGYY